MINNKKKIINAIIITIVIFLIIFSFLKIEYFINEKRMNKYIKDNNFQLEKYNIYTLTTTTNNGEIISKLLYDKYYFTKYQTKTINNNTEKIKYYYNNKKEIIIEYEEFTTTENSFNINSVKATFKKNKLTKCESLIGNNINCDKLTDYAINYNNEINAILEKYKINLNFLKIKTDILN